MAPTTSTALDCVIWAENPSLLQKMRTKVELGFNNIARINDLADLAGVLFPGNKRHQKAFLAVVVELKYADQQFLPALEWIAAKYGFSRRVLELVRAKIRRLGVIDHVSRFNQRFGYREGWIFSKRFQGSLERLGSLWSGFVVVGDARQERRDRDVFRYL